eukprot:TRINITY_DN11601_c0_g1_i3.p1 TRINITY_DN11601_c0_g1~~TRINITY_DN11601_c0_g1_i3.p1  ORF type:complete len:195 (+),score=21.85 TRINITY_DN11601_c0_g1_i3:56-640(+)
MAGFLSGEQRLLAFLVVGVPALICYGGYRLYQAHSELLDYETTTYQVVAGSTKGPYERPIEMANAWEYVCDYEVTVPGAKTPEDKPIVLELSGSADNLDACPEKVQGIDSELQEGHCYLVKNKAGEPMRLAFTKADVAPVQTSEMFTDSVVGIIFIAGGILGGLAGCVLWQCCKQDEGSYSGYGNQEGYSSESE